MYMFLYIYMFVKTMPTFLQAPKKTLKKKRAQFIWQAKFPTHGVMGDGWMFVCQVPPLQWQQVMRFWRVNLDQQLDKSENFKWVFPKIGVFATNWIWSNYSDSPQKVGIFLYWLSVFCTFLSLQIWRLKAQSLPQALEPCCLNSHGRCF